MYTSFRRLPTRLNYEKYRQEHVSLWDSDYNNNNNWDDLYSAVRMGITKNKGAEIEATTQL